MINVPLYLAPMAGITDKPFRKIVRRFGQQALFTEMIGVETLLHGHPTTRKMLQLSDEQAIVVQLVGADAAHMALAAKMAQDAGAVGIDINMGCPVKKLISNCSGAKLMCCPERAAALVEAVSAAVQIPVSVKMRLGWDCKHINAVTFAKLMEQAGAKRLTVHGRTKEQGYAGTADWQMIGAVKRAVSIPVIANGDIVDEYTACEALRVSGADGLMIGRGALGRPWILSQIETGFCPDFDLTNVVLAHLDELLHYYGSHGLLVARKHIAWYAKGKKSVAPFCQRVYAETNSVTVKRMIRDFFAGEK
ncbi:MAG: tRNA dihydrouridine synthase DusB [Alphaproteobacteria bacterium]